MTDTFDAPASKIPRDRWDRPKVQPPGGDKLVSYTRCTTFVDCLEDKYNLSRWSQRLVAIGMAERPDLVMAAATTDRDSRDGKDALDRIVDQATEAAKIHAAASVGTALHTFAERHDRGQPLGNVPEPYLADVQAYRHKTAEFEHVAIEQFTVLDDLKIGGTPDRVVKFQGRHYIADIKTGSVEYGAAKFAMQLAVYARSTPYDHVTQTRTPYPAEVDTDRAIIIHLPAGKGVCQLYWLDIATGWDGVQLATQVRAWRKPRTLMTGMTTNADALPQGLDVSPLAGIHHASTVGELRDLYRTAVAAGASPTDLAAACLARKAELEGAPA